MSPAQQRKEDNPETRADLISSLLEALMDPGTRYLVVTVEIADDNTARQRAHTNMLHDTELWNKVMKSIFELNPTTQPGG